MTNLLTRPRVPDGCGGTDGGAVAWVGLTSCTAPSLGSLLHTELYLARGARTHRPRGAGAQDCRAARRYSSCSASRARRSFTRMASSAVRARVAVCLGCSLPPSRLAPMANAYSHEAMCALSAASASASSAFSLSITHFIEPAGTDGTCPPGGAGARHRRGRSVGAELARDHAAGRVERTLARQ